MGFVSNETIDMNILASKNIKDGSIIRFKKEMYLECGKIEKDSLMYVQKIVLFPESAVIYVRFFSCNKETTFNAVVDRQNGTTNCFFTKNDSQKFIFEDNLEIVDMPKTTIDVLALEKLKREKKNNSVASGDSATLWFSLAGISFFIGMFASWISKNPFEKYFLALGLILPVVFGAIGIIRNKTKYKKKENLCNELVSFIEDKLIQIDTQIKEGREQ